MCLRVVAIAIMRATSVPRSYLPLHSQLVEDVLNQLAQIFIDVATIAVESLSDVLERLEEAVEVHLGIFASLDHVLVYDIVMGLCNVRVRH